MKVDFLIVGQGLAGSLLSWQLISRGQRVLVVDRDEETTSSKVAAGLVTPIAGSRFNMPEGLERNLNFAKKLYWDLEESSGQRLFHHLRIARLFQDEKEVSAWDRRLAEEPGKFAGFHEPLTIDPDQFRLPHGGFEMCQSGWLNLPAFLELIRQMLLERAAYAIGTVHPADIQILPDTVRWKNVEAKTVVFCQGWEGCRNAYFDWLPWNAARGDVLEVRMPNPSGETRIVNRGGWLLPRGENIFRAGSTYDHHFRDASPSEEGKEEVLRKISRITREEPEVVSHFSAIRPSIRRSQIIMGRHPEHGNLAFFNGLGSKGVLNGPWHAHCLAEHLLSGTPIPEAADLQSNFL